MPNWKKCWRTKLISKIFRAGCCTTTTKAINLGRFFYSQYEMNDISKENSMLEKKPSREVKKLLKQIHELTEENVRLQQEVESLKNTLLKQPGLKPRKKNKITSAEYQEAVRFQKEYRRQIEHKRLKINNPPKVSIMHFVADCKGISTRLKNILFELHCKSARILFVDDIEFEMLRGGFTPWNEFIFSCESYLTDVKNNPEKLNKPKVTINFFIDNCDGISVRLKKALAKINGIAPTGLFIDEIYQQIFMPINEVGIVTWNEFVSAREKFLIEQEKMGSI